MTTSPEPFYVGGVSPSSIHVSITSDGSSGDKVDLNCYYGSGSPSPVPIAAGITLGSGGGFSGAVSSSALLTPTTCVLRAVPAGDKTDYPPGAASNFSGPRVGLGGLKTFTGKGPDASIIDDFYAARGQLQGGMDYDSVGSCGLDDSYVFNPTTFAESNALFFCDDYLWPFDGVHGSATPDAQHSAATRSELRVDGVNAYMPTAAGAVYSNADATPGLQSVASTISTDAATGDTTITDTENAVFCAPDPATFPATPTSCSHFVPAGVGIARTIVQDHAGRVVRIDDRWFGDGHPHAIDLELEQDINGAKADSAFQFPWVSASFAQHNAGDTLPGAPSAPGSIFIKGSAATPSSGDAANPHGAITFASPPDSARFTQSDGGAGPSTLAVFTLNYHRFIPANGSLFLSFTYSDAFALPEVQSDASAAQSTYAPPSVAITSPANESTVGATPVTISGTVGGSQPVGQVVVNGVVATLGAGGTWSAQVPLSPGANAVSAFASTVYGATSQAQETINYVVPSAPNAKLSLSGAIKKIINGLRFRLQCLFATCHGTAVLTAAERVRKRHVVGLAAHTRKRTVVVGRVFFTISGGQSKVVSVTLNRTGRKLLARFKRLPVKLTVSLMQANGKPLVIKTAKFTLKPHKNKKRKR